MASVDPSPPSPLRIPPSSSPTPSTASSPRAGVVYSTMGEFDIREHYVSLLRDDPTKSMPIAAIESLSALCDNSKAGTIHELMSTINDGAKVLTDSIPNAISLTAGCDLFKKFIISHAHDNPQDFEAFKTQLQQNGHLFAQRAREARNKVAELGVKSIKDGVTVFLHGHSRCVMALLMKAVEQKINFKAIVTETRPSCSGLQTAKELREKGVPVAVINDNAVGYALKKARIVLLGAEAVYGDGSALNIMGSHQVALAAKEFNRPVYIAAETHKFVDIFPLDQFTMFVNQDVINFDPPQGVDGPMPQDNQEFVDWVPRQLIKGFITEVGLKTPQSVSDSIVGKRFE